MHGSSRAGSRALGVAALAVVAGLAAACGSGGSSSSPSTTATITTTPAAVTGGSATSGGTRPSDATTTATTTVQPKAGGKLVMGVEAEVANPFVPQEVQCDSSCQLRLRTIFEPLFATDANGNMRPYLAEKLDVNADSTVFTITLRKGITFTDGTPFDAAAAAENARRYIASPLLAAALLDVARSPDGTPKITVKDQYTFEIATSRPWYDFPYYLGSLQASPTWLKKTDTDKAAKLQPVGTGPFVLDSWKPGSAMVVKKNPSYWRKDASGNPLPYLDSIEFRVIPDALSRANALKTGDVDLIQTSDGQTIANFRKDKSVNLVEQSDRGETFYVLEHVGQAGSPLQDQRVRCGLAAATDTKTLATATGGGVLPVANGLFSPGQQGYLDNPGNQTYDPAKAKDLIAQYTKEKGKPKIIYSTTTDSTALQTAQLLQQWWGDAGVDVQINQIEQSKLITNALLGDDAFMAFGWRNHGGFVVDQQYVWWHGKLALPKGQLALNFGRLNDPVINDLLDKNRSEPDPANRKADAEAVNRRFAQQCWVIPTSWAIWGIASKPAVMGIGTSTFPGSTDRVRDGAGFAGQVWLDAVWLER